MTVPKAKDQNRVVAKTIMVVDDHKEIVQFLKLGLKREGYIVATAEDGREALKQIKKNPPDLIILDLQLPIMAGEEVCKQIREGEDLTLRKIPIIMLTGKNTDTDRILGRVLGANCYMTKPFQMQVLLDNIRQLLAG